MASYDLVAVARVPAASGPPSLTEVERITAPQITWVDDLEGPGSIAFSCEADRLPDAVKARLRNLKEFPTEVWLHRDDAVIAAGIIETYQLQQGTLSATCPGLLHYLAYMQVETDLTYTGVDQFTIAKGLVDHWQSLDFGHYGIDTSSIGTSGVSRGRPYLAAEQHQILQRVLELSNADDGFDIYVDPLSRALVLEHPYRGTDLTDSVVFDGRNITDAGIAISVAPGDLASEAYGQGTSEANPTITSHQTNMAIRASWGRAATSGNFDGVSVQGTLDGHTRKLLDDAAAALFLPGPGLLPVADVDVTSFEPGDIVAYSFDAGLGLQSVTGRVHRKQVTVDKQGGESMAIALGAVPAGDDPWTVLASAVGELRRDVGDLRSTALARA